MTSPAPAFGGYTLNNAPGRTSHGTVLTRWMRSICPDGKTAPHCGHAVPGRPTLLSTDDPHPMIRCQGCLPALVGMTDDRICHLCGRERPAFREFTVKDTSQLVITGNACRECFAGIFPRGAQPVLGPSAVIPAALRSARFVPRQHADRREPMRVTPGEFTAAGLPVPADPARWNAYRLSRQQGWPWDPGLDHLTSLHGAEILPGPFVCVDCDTHLAIDGSVWADGFRWLADRATEAGEILDLPACLAVRTPGHLGRSPGHDHGPGWHLWYAASPDHPVRTGPLPQCSAVEIKNRCTSPGSPGYDVRHAPDVLPPLPAWIAALAERPGSPQGSGGSSNGGNGSRQGGGPPLPPLAELLRAGLPVGGRNDTLLRLACSRYWLHGTGPGGHAAVLADLGRVLAATDCSGFGDYEIAATVDRARRFIEGQEQDEEQMRRAVPAWMGTTGVTQ